MAAQDSKKPESSEKKDDQKEETRLNTKVDIRGAKTGKDADKKAPKDRLRDGT